jgi:RNA polymerase sigma factor (sigma-70 family)
MSGPVMAFGGYRLDARRSRPLSAQEEQAIAAEYQRTRDPALAARLVEANLRLVLMIARQYPHSPAVLPDLVQEGNLGLVEAALRFDPTRGVRFASYAGFWVRAFITKYRRDNARMVRAGRSRADRVAFQKGQLPPADVSLQTGSGRPDEAGMEEAIADPKPSAEALLERAQSVARTRARLTALAGEPGSRESALIEHRLLSEDPAPLRRLAARFRVSGERLRQVEQGLVARLRTSLAAA